MTAPHSLLTLARRLLAAVLCAAATGGAVNAATAPAGLASFGGTTVVSFDEAIVGWSLTTQYVGVGILDFDATVLGTQGSAAALDHAMFGLDGAISGTKIGFMGASIRFAADVDRVGVWLYQGNGMQYLSALDADQNVLLTLSAADALEQHASFGFVGMQSDARDIRYVVISNKDLAVDPNWSPTGYTSFYDDLMFTPISAVPAVPEPQTWLMLAMCLALMGLIVRRKR
jgi:hypothetical protein